MPHPLELLKNWKPKVVDRPHPDGEKGVRLSLDEVAKGIIDTLNDGEQLVKVRTYAIELLDAAKKRGESIDNHEARARILLKGVQDDKLWVPDPVGIELMPSPELMACKDPSKPCLKGDDCDGLARLLGAMMSSIGIYTMVVGHSYDKDKQIEHVLIAVHNGKRWLHADPSTSLPLGQSLPFTRERTIAIPTGEVLCDGDVCVKNSKTKPTQIESKLQGRFVGVSGVPASASSARKIVWLRRPRFEWITP